MHLVSASSFAWLNHLVSLTSGMVIRQVNPAAPKASAIIVDAPFWRVHWWKFAIMCASCIAIASPLHLEATQCRLLSKHAGVHCGSYRSNSG